MRVLYLYPRFRQVVDVQVYQQRSSIVATRPAISLFVSTLFKTFLPVVSLLPFTTIALLSSSVSTFLPSPSTTRTGTTILLGSFASIRSNNNRHHYHSHHHFTIPPCRRNMSTTTTDSNRDYHLHHLPEKVVIVGSSNQDLTAYTTNTLPSPGETVMGERFQISPGGKGANQAIAAAKLLVDNNDNHNHDNHNHDKVVHIITRLGNDAFAKLLLQNFDQNNVQYNPQTITCTEPKNAHTGVAPIIVNQQTGDNMIVVVPGANHLLTPEMVCQEMMSIQQLHQNNNQNHNNDLNKNNNKKNKSSKDFQRVIVLSQLEIPLESTFEAMKIGKQKWGAITILNPAPCNTNILDYNDNGNENVKLLQLVDILIPNETELKQLAQYIISRSKDTTIHDNYVDGMTEEQMAKLLLDQGVSTAVIVTLGARGAMIVARDCETQMIIAPPELQCHDQPVVDTVGAGDSFCGAFSMYLSSGMTLYDAAVKACGVASISVRKEGAQSSYPYASDLPPILRLGADNNYDDNDNNNNNNASSESLNKQTLTFVTGNKKKLEEVQQILLNGETLLPFDITNKKIDLPELQGDPIDIAKEKCALAAKEVNGPVFTEDTSLCFNALNSLPGPYIKWFLDKCGHGGLNKMLCGFDDKTAYAETIVAFTWGPGKEIHIFDGRTNGSIVQARGPLDFGWDPIFLPDEGEGKTYAEMTKKAKNKISHRGKSFVKFQAFLASYDSKESA